MRVWSPLMCAAVAMAGKGRVRAGAPGSEGVSGRNPAQYGQSRSAASPMGLPVRVLDETFWRGRAGRGRRPGPCGTLRGPRRRSGMTALTGAGAGRFLNRTGPGAVVGAVSAARRRAERRGCGRTSRGGSGWKWRTGWGYGAPVGATAIGLPGAAGLVGAALPLAGADFHAWLSSFPPGRPGSVSGGHLPAGPGNRPGRERGRQR